MLPREIRDVVHFGFKQVFVNYDSGQIVASKS